MTQRRPMTEDEKAAIMMEVIKLREEGRHAEADVLFTQFPIAPYLAKIAKKLWGADFLINQGYNLSEAEAEYGPGWLNS